MSQSYPVGQAPWETGGQDNTSQGFPVGQAPWENQTPTDTTSPDQGWGVGLIKGAGSVVKGIGSALTTNEQGLAKDLTSAYGAKQLSPAEAALNGKTVGQLITHAHQLPMGDPRRTQLLQLANQMAGGSAGQAQEQLASIPSNEHALGDVAGTGLDVLAAGTYGQGTAGMVSGELGKAAPTALSGLTKGVGFLQGAGQGALQGAKAGGLIGAGYGAVHGLQADKSALGVAGSAVEGGVSGAAVGGVIGGITGGISGAAKAKTLQKLKDSLSGKSIDDILATPESDVHKLNPTERAVWFDNAKQQLSDKYDAVDQNIKQTLQDKAQTAQDTAEQLQRDLATSTRDETIALRPKILQAMGQQSQTYRQLVQEDLAPVADNVIKTTDLNSYVDNRFADNPDMANAIKLKLGTVEQVNSLADTTESLSKVRPETTIGELYQRTLNLKQDIGTAATKGSRVFTPSEKLTDDAISTLSGYLKDNGVDLSNANQFWASYAPVRNQLVSEAKPFVQSGTLTKTFANTLMRVAKGTDVNNENFISQVEDLVGQPINSDAKNIVSQMSTNEKTALADKISAEAQKLDNQLAKESALKSLSTRQFDVERAAKMRDIVKKVLISLPVLFTGDKLLKRFTGVGF